MVHYLHIAYHGIQKDKTGTFDGDLMVAIEKCTIVQLRECLKNMLENLGMELDEVPVITSMTELKPKLFKMLYGNNKINVISIED